MSSNPKAQRDREIGQTSMLEMLEEGTPAGIDDRVPEEIEAAQVATTDLPCPNVDGGAPDALDLDPDTGDPSPPDGSVPQVVEEQDGAPVQELFDPNDPGQQLVRAALLHGLIGGAMRKTDRDG